MPDERGTVLVTGGAGFIGRWVVDALLNRCTPPHHVVVLDNLSNGSRENLSEFDDHSHFLEFVRGDIRDEVLTANLFRRHRFQTVFHLAACINVQESIDDPVKVFQADVVGTFALLECARKAKARFVFISTCMVYDACTDEGGIVEGHPLKPASPYAAAKLAGENLALSYYFAYGLPVTVLRPFNTYGPFQKSTGEGGVVSIFCERQLRGEELRIYGDGTQTRDLLFATDCARFIVLAGFHPKAEGRTINAGLGEDVSVNALASMICPDEARILHVPHIHPQSEIARLKCNRSLAYELLGWAPEISLADGIGKTSQWIANAEARGQS